MRSNETYTGDFMHSSSVKSCVIMSRVTEQEYAALKAAAERLTDGNVAAMIRLHVINGNEDYRIASKIGVISTILFARYLKNCVVQWLAMRRTLQNQH